MAKTDTGSPSPGLGVQLVLTLLFASLMSRLMSTRLSLARRILDSKLVRYAAPSNEALKALLNAKKSGKKSRNNEEESVFSFARSLNFSLDLRIVQMGQIVQLKFFDEFLWLVDFALYATLIYVASEVYHVVLPERACRELNLSLLWLMLALGFALKSLFSLTKLLLQQSGGERSFVLVMFAVYLLLAMATLALPDFILENRLDHAHEALDKANEALNTGLNSQGLASKLMLKLLLSLICATLGALLTFPGLRLARSQNDALATVKSNFDLLLLHTNYIAPLILVVMWVPPLSREVLTQTVYKGLRQPLMSSAQFECLRLYLVVSTCILRLALTPKYLQAYLDLAYYKTEQLRREAGRITNVELQQSVSRIFYYLIVVALQYLAPVILVLNLSLLLKTLGNGSWNIFNAEASVQEDAVIKTVNSSFEWTNLREVFSPDVFNGLLGFALWWSCFVWFVSAAIGTAYHSYFSKA